MQKECDTHYTTSYVYFQVSGFPFTLVFHETQNALPERIRHVVNLLRNIGAQPQEKGENDGRATNGR